LIIDGIGSISWISCHDLAPYLKRRFHVDTRQQIIIPGEHRHRRKMVGPDDAGLALPAVHAAVNASIAARPGEVYLIAAGFLGKIYAETVRQQGGVAIDIGSLADFWMGHKTRAYRALPPIERAHVRTA
jgi:hypothetical protein